MPLITYQTYISHSWQNILSDTPVINEALLFLNILKDAQKPENRPDTFEVRGCFLVLNGQRLGKVLHQKIKASVGFQFSGPEE